MKLFIFALLFSSSVYAQETTDFSDLISSAVYDGKPLQAKSSMWHHVVRLSFIKADASRKFGTRSTCTATIIAEKLLLTAAHCVDDKITPDFLLGIEFFKDGAKPSMKLFSPGDFKFFAHRGYNPKGSDSDLAIIHLREKITNEEFYPVNLFDDNLSDMIRGGVPVIFVGSGTGRKLSFQKTFPLALE